MWNKDFALRELQQKTGSAAEAQKILLELEVSDAARRSDIIGEYDLSLRVCVICGELMGEGYLDECETFCSESCLKKHCNWTDADFQRWGQEWTAADPLFWTVWQE